MGKTKPQASGSRVYLREVGEDGRERYAGSLAGETITGPGSTSTVTVDPVHDSRASDVNLDTLAAKAGALVGQRVPVDVALQANFLGDDVEAEFCIDGEYVSGTRGDLRAATFGGASEILFCDELGEHYVAYSPEGAEEEIHLVNCGSVVFPEDDLDGLSETLDVLALDAESDTDSAKALETLDRFYETGEAGQIALLEAAGHLISVREQIEDSYDMGVWNNYEHSLRDGFSTLQDALPLHMVEAIAQEYCGRDANEVQALLSDGLDPWG